MTGSVQKKWFPILFIILLFPLLTQAQVIKGKKNQAIARQAINDLQNNGALVLRLKTKRNKIEKLNELLARPDLEEKDKKKLMKELKTTIEERDKYNYEITKAFNTYYKFSAFYFMHDTSSVALKNGEKSGFLLDKDLNIDPNITITQDSFFVAYTGSLNASNMEALIIMNSRFEVLPSPFPYYIRVNLFGRVLVKIFAPKKVVRKDMKKIVTRLEKNLNNFYKKP